MLDPKELMGLVNKGGPIVAETKRLLQDPETPIRTKAQLFSTMILPEFRKLKNEPSIAMMLPMLVEMGVMQAKAQFKALPKEQLIAQINAEKAMLPADMLTALIKAEGDNFVAKAKEEAKKVTPKSSTTAPQSEDEKVEAYLDEIFAELDEDEYVDFSMTIAKLIPSRLFNTFAEGKSEAELEEKIRKSYLDFASGKGKKTQKADAVVTKAAVEKFIASDEVVDSLVEAFGKVSGEKLFGIAEDVVDGIDSKSVTAIVENALVAIEDALEAAKNDGNPLRLTNADAAKTVFAEVSKITQLVEDAVVNADILPDMDVKAVYAKCKEDAAAEAALKSPKGPKGPK